MRQHVSLQVNFLDKAFAAELAAVRFLLLVKALVRLQGDLLAKPLSAETADERFLPRVNPHVRVQVAYLAKVLPTNATGVWFLSGVDPLVHVQVLAHGEPLVADIAGVNPRFPARVALDVSPEDGVLDEGLTTELADERPLPRVQLHVSLQRTFPWEVLAAVLAAERFLTGVCPHVDFHVPETNPANVTDLDGVSVVLDVDPQTLRRRRRLTTDPAETPGIVHMSLSVSDKVAFVVEAAATHLTPVRGSEANFEPSAPGGGRTIGRVGLTVSLQVRALRKLL